MTQTFAATTSQVFPLIESRSSPDDGFDSLMLRAIIDPFEVTASAFFHGATPQRVVQQQFTNNPDYHEDRRSTISTTNDTMQPQIKKSWAYFERETSQQQPLPPEKKQQHQNPAAAPLYPSISFQAVGVGGDHEASRENERIQHVVGNENASELPFFPQHYAQDGNAVTIRGLSIEGKSPYSQSSSCTTHFLGNDASSTRVPSEPNATRRRVLNKKTDQVRPKKEDQEQMKQPVISSLPEVRFRSHQAENWMEKFEELLDFRLKNGHCLVPNAFKESPSLAEWVKRQRYQYKLRIMGQHSTMSEDRIGALEKLGFVWNSHDQVWEERLKELSAYSTVFLDCNVPSNYAANPQLAIWVKRQRRQHKFLKEGKASTMTPSRIAKLTELGFAWSGRKPKQSYQK